MKSFLTCLILIISLHLLLFTTTNAQEISEDTQTCIDCHVSATPGIVGDWQKSLHANSSLQKAFLKSELERRISISNLPET